MSADKQDIIGLADAITALARCNADHSFAISELAMNLYRRLGPWSRGRRENIIGAQRDLADALEAAEEALEKTDGRGEERDNCMWLQGCVERLQTVVLEEKRPSKH